MSENLDRQPSRFVSIPDIYESEDSEDLKKAQEELQVVLAALAPTDLAPTDPTSLPAPTQ